MTDVKHFLQDQKSKDDTKNLYDHLTNVLGKILLENPRNAYDVFENYSHEIKDTGYDYKHPSAFETKSKQREKYTEIQSWAEKTRSLLDVKLFFILFSNHLL
jgi:radial spoke head protein 4A